MNYVERSQQLIRLAEVERLSWPELCRVIRGWVLEVQHEADRVRGRKRGG